MIVITIVLCSILTMVIVWEKRKEIKVKQELDYIRIKLSDIMKEETKETVKLMTDEKEIKELLIVLNEMLNYNHHNLVRYNKSKLAMKKMLSNISHDLKTPLTVVQGYLEMLEMKYKDDETIHKAYQRTQDVIQLMNQFFDLAKLESGDTKLQKEKVNISELCRITLLDYYHILEEQSYNISIDILEKPLFVMANEDAVRRILNNLISNAIKYGGSGKYIGVKVKEQTQNVLVCVVDHGKGIEEQHKEEIFERMYTLEDSRSKNYQGSGLGLTITKELVEKQGGEIHLDSKPYEETVFSFTLPKVNY